VADRQQEQDSRNLAVGLVSTVEVMRPGTTHLMGAQIGVGVVWESSSVVAGPLSADAGAEGSSDRLPTTSCSVADT
jgi:hypothetical protein